MKSSALKRGTKPLRRRKRLNPMSAKRRAELDVLDRVQAKVYERAEGRCEAQGTFDHFCSGGFHFHHVKPRSRGGKHTVANVVHICSWVHAWAHSNQDEAHVLGLLRHSWD